MLVGAHSLFASARAYHLSGRPSLTGFVCSQGHRFEIGGVEELSSGFTRIVADLVRMCCSHEPRVRPSFSDILYVLDFVLEPNKQLGLGKTIPSSVWKMLERTERKTPVEELDLEPMLGI